ncbi:MAG: helix-turn-helix transcriptional regulator, partial [Akkermansiaceae bacterium]|nr:helix-turn-helix transcriptional regulator [Akkermansiaceae bacterium]
MKLLFTTDWLKRTITADPEGDVEAGPPLVDDTDDAANITTMPDRNVVQLRMALGVFVRQLRLRDGLSVTELAQAAHVSEEE